jgi:hypothetical protein
LILSFATKDFSSFFRGLIIGDPFNPVPALRLYKAWLCHYIVSGFPHSCGCPFRFLRYSTGFCPPPSKPWTPTLDPLCSRSYLSPLVSCFLELACPQGYFIFLNLGAEFFTGSLAHWSLLTDSVYIFCSGFSVALSGRWVWITWLTITRMVDCTPAICPLSLCPSWMPDQICLFLTV